MSKTSKTAGKTYIPGRDSTAGRNNDNQELKELDRKYGSDPAREGTNSKRDSFGNGKRS